MEHLSLNEPPAPGQGGGPQPPTGPQGPLGPAMLGRAPPPPQQLPAQMFTTAAQLLDLTDKKLMIVLRDGRKLMGVLRSWDQFANLVIQSTVERIFVTPESVPETHATGAEKRGLYADVPLGMFLVRGENVMLLGEIDLDKDDDPPPGYDKADPALVEKLAKEKKVEEKSRDKKKLKKFSALGFEGETVGDVLI
ncbi:hypothetical protein M406DRAFT_356100 [Cryphonectria parasitica EP155]|uniref:U6 snRNA-associated Sm-like protein LSm1 n=1 Tax=Cryphonectria parasitica (strain ATCC 38755 / EP155) TaxID=660469 RepID=A0A9P5CQB7_CRYP1|nr:uncharacterized protein M406DRAFT_356100 [Cryphonectria parasitica EP155]KAF3765875.1 hypothetical protein M406DRAFT_356100 [Cryphonectria parasitica EP155]